MGKILEMAARPETLQTAWAHYRNDKADWRPGIGRGVLEKQLVYHILTLSKELRSGDYLPDPIRQVDIHKADGSNRKITVFSLRDKVAQRALLTVIEPIGEALFHKDSFAYRPGRNIDMAVRMVAELSRRDSNPWLVHTDIRSCFESIPVGSLLRQLKPKINDSEALGLISRWHGLVHEMPVHSQSRKGIPLGGVLSPFFCNFFLTTVDRTLEREGIRFVRYSDDLMLVAASRNEAEKICRFLQGVLQRNGLVINHEKTTISRYSTKVIFLGKNLPENNGARWRNNNRREWRYQDGWTQKAHHGL
ncbi:MAG: hypothetical protein A2511_09100 [Deltaproteobacteria bacterium RIFOXYD12_FULL_50_9]|nr:MAG: hypothetical protein A2511_09100 [Deltaproteobacteria bacterium RIFOXYD12_FULL_50_9]